MDAIGQLAGGVAHDFNNLLTGMMAFTELLLEHLPPDDPLREGAEEALKSCQRSALLTRQLLAMSRRRALEPLVLDLNTVIADMSTMLRRLIGEDIVLTVLIEPAPARVKADAGQMEQAIMNLAINARDAMPNGGKLRITLANVVLDADAASRYDSLTAGRYVQLDVIDNGIGMSADTMSKIFEPFFTTKEEGKGTGLGLAMVYGLVKQSGGTIEVDSRVGEGTRFRILLPLCDEDDATLPSTPADESTHGTEILLLVTMSKLL